MIEFPPDAAPTPLEAFNKKYEQHYHITGYGIAGMRVHYPCPFCAAPEWLVTSLLSFERAMARGATCTECGREAHLVVQRPDESTTVAWLELLSGPDVPEFFPTGYCRRAS